MAANDLPDNDGVTIAGLVKHDPGAGDVIAFSASLSCEDWLAVPTSMIADITHLRNVKCKGHRHPLVTSGSSSPIPRRPSWLSWSGLVSELQRAVARLRRSRANGGSVTPFDFDDCYTVIDNGKVKVCCGNPPECTGVADVAQ
jgi:hypothetical protein